MLEQLATKAAACGIANIQRLTHPLLKNAVRFSLRLREKPLPPPKWEALACAACVHEVCVSRIVSDACLLTATKPPAEEYRGVTGTAPLGIR
jgi:hypothetical protein